MSLAVTYKVLAACLALVRTGPRPEAPPTSRLCDLDARTLRDIGFASPAAGWQTAPFDHDPRLFG